jgi:hypothetical protein
MQQQMDWLTRIREQRAEARAHALNAAIRALPLSTRQAMLAATEDEDLIAGGYTDGSGHSCPMLAAHRRGARTQARGFPCAWDAFTGASRPRPATRRELDVLRALLQESIADGVAPQDPDRSGATSTRADGIQVLSEL